MIKTNTTLIIVILFSILSGCGKKPFDYRNKYLGDYRITYHYNYWQIDGATSDTTIQYTGAVEYGDKNSIQIEWHDGSKEAFSVSKEGIISRCNSTIGKISKKEFDLSFTDDLCGTGPLGSDYKFTLHGDKK